MKYIFPNLMIPSAKRITDAAEGLFYLNDRHNFGPDYDKTLIARHRNFHDNRDKLKRRYDGRFKRMCDHFLLSSAGSFRAKHNQVWQNVFSKFGYEGRYNSIR